MASSHPVPDDEEDWTCDGLPHKYMHFPWELRFFVYILIIPVGLLLECFSMVFMLLNYAEMTQVDTRILYVLYGSYAISLVFSAYLFLRGYFSSPLIEPETDSKYDQLRCVQENIKVWVDAQHPAWTAERRSLECSHYQGSLALYMADPDQCAEFSVRDFVFASIVAVLMYATGSISIHYGMILALDLPEMFPVLRLPTQILINLPMVIMSNPLQLPRYCLGRRGRGLRMRSSVRKIRRDCLSGDVEKGAESAREKLTWWIENLVMGDKIQREKSGGDEELRKRTKKLLGEISVKQYAY